MSDGGEIRRQAGDGEQLRDFAPVESIDVDCQVHKAVDFGAAHPFGNLTREQRLARLYKTKEWPSVHRWPGGFRFPGGESFAEMSVRTMDAVLGLVADHPGESIVAVSHADCIKAVVAAAAGVPLDLMQRLVVSPCSISAVLFTAGGPLVLCVNSTGALDELVPS